MYTPKSEETLAKEGLLPDGEYDFEVVDTSDKPSKKGNDMFTLKLYIFNDKEPISLYDYIALGNHFGERKLRHAADACKLLDIYESGKLKASDFMGKTGKVKIKMAEGNADYPLPKNVVSDYVLRPKAETVETGAIIPEEKAKSILGDDDIPF